MTRPRPPAPTAPWPPGVASRRRLLGAATAAALGGWAAVSAQQRPRFALATAAKPPFSRDGTTPGFLDRLAAEAFGRLGAEAVVQHLPGERALLNADAGIDDGDMMRIGGLQAEYRNLVQVPEKIFDFEFTAFARRPDVQVGGWADLARHAVGYVIGWKLYERQVQGVRDLAVVRSDELLFPLLDSGRADVVLLERWQGLWLARRLRQPVRLLQPALASAEMFVYLHRRHRAMVAPLARAFAELRRDGTWQRLHDEVLRPLEPAR